MLDAGCLMLGSMAPESFAASRETTPRAGKRLFCIAAILAALSDAIRCSFLWGSVQRGPWKRTVRQSPLEAGDRLTKRVCPEFAIAVAAVL
jgi:hypothetical protein